MVGEASENAGDVSAELSAELEPDRTIVEVFEKGSYQPLLLQEKRGFSRVGAKIFQKHLSPQTQTSIALNFEVPNRLACAMMSNYLFSFLSHS
jgi:hypothetical protein